MDKVLLARKDAILIEETQIEIVKLLSDGFNVKAIAEKTKINVRTLEAKLSVWKDNVDAETLPHLVAIFFRNKLIE